MRYTIQIWVLTIIVSPLLLLLILGVIINQSSPNEILNSSGIIVLMFIVGFIFSIPAMIIFWFLQRNLNSGISIWKRKLILSIYSFLSVWVTFYFVDSGFITSWSNQTIWVLIYSLTIVVGVWVFRFPSTNSLKQQ